MRRSPVDHRGGGEVPGVSEPAQHQVSAVLQLSAIDGFREAQRHRRAEQVAVSLEGRDVPFRRQLKRLAPVAQEDAVGLVGDQCADLAGRQVRPAARFTNRVRHDAIGSAHDLRELRLGEVNVAASRTRFPPLAAVRANDGHVARIFAVVPLNDGLDRRFAGSDQVSHTTPIAWNQRLFQLASLVLREESARGVLDVAQQRGLGSVAAHQRLCLGDHANE